MTTDSKRKDGDVVVKKAKADSESGSAPNTWWAVGAFIVFVHVVGLYALLFRGTNWNIYWATILSTFFTAFGITAGYHRLWTHRAYNASLPLRVILAILGTNATQGSIKWWALRHRLHHRFVDTEHDPYDSTRGFFYSHMGWMFQKPHYPRMKLIDASDLNADPVVRFQHRYFVPLLFTLMYGWPALVGWYFGDLWGGMLWVGFVSRIYVWHATWSINSFAHWMGERLFCDQISARGNFLCALLTVGEGYHNFHHEFPRDFRNGVRWYDFDPTKWSIRLWYALGLATDLHRTTTNSMLQARVQVCENRVAQTRARLQWGPAESSLPEMTREQFRAKCEAEGKEWCIIRGFAIDFTEFQHDHPGGAKILKAYRGKDATQAFEGGMNIHSQSAKNLAAMHRVARII